VSIPTISRLMQQIASTRRGRTRVAGFTADRVGVIAI
jgi:hypothetical protein